MPGAGYLEVGVVHPLNRACFFYLLLSRIKKNMLQRQNKVDAAQNQPNCYSMVVKFICIDFDKSYWKFRISHQQ